MQARVAQHDVALLRFAVLEEIEVLVRDVDDLLVDLIHPQVVLGAIDERRDRADAQAHHADPAGGLLLHLEFESDSTAGTIAPVGDFRVVALGWIGELPAVQNVAAAEGKVLPLGLVARADLHGDQAKEAAIAMDDFVPGLRIVVQVTRDLPIDNAGQRRCRDGGDCGRCCPAIVSQRQCERRPGHDDRNEKRERQLKERVEHIRRHEVHKDAAQRAAERHRQEIRREVTRRRLQPGQLAMADQADQQERREIHPAVNDPRSQLDQVSLGTAKQTIYAIIQ